MRCPECGVGVGKRHLSGCSLKYATRYEKQIRKIPEGLKPMEQR
jgi:hypothetical protein